MLYHLAVNCAILHHKKRDLLYSQLSVRDNYVLFRIFRFFASTRRSLLTQLSLYVHKGDLNHQLFHFHFKMGTGVIFPKWLGIKH